MRFVSVLLTLVMFIDHSVGLRASTAVATVRVFEGGARVAHVSGRRVRSLLLPGVLYAVTVRCNLLALLMAVLWCMLIALIWCML